MKNRQQQPNTPPDGNTSTGGVVGWFLRGLNDNLLFQIAAVILLAIVGYVVSVISGVMVSPFEATPVTLPASILIYENCYHLGDATSPGLCPNAPQTNPFEGKFQVKGTSDSAYIRLTVKDVTPGEIQRPIRIYVNGIFVDFLNRYVREDTPDSKEIEIPIPKGILRIGENNILIFASPNIQVPQQGIDDFEFRNLEIVFK